MNRVISHIEAIEQEAKQSDRERQRMARSMEMLGKAIAEASSNHLAVTVVKNELGELEKFFLSDERRTVLFMPRTNSIYLRNGRAPKYSPIRDLPELDCYDVVHLFAEGKFNGNQ